MARAVGKARWPLGLFILIAAPTARADRIVLRHGDDVRGVVLPEETKARPGFVMVQTPAVATPLAFPREQVVRVVEEPGPLRDYLSRRDKAKATAEAQFELATWCEGQKLGGPAENHYRRAVELDKDFAPAHKKLGHVLHDGRWMTYDEMKLAQGMVKVRGRWVSKQEQEKIEGKAAATAGQATWSRRLKVLRNALINGTQPQQIQAEAQVVAIDDPTAVEPLMQAFGRDPVPLRRLLDRTLGNIAGTEAMQALVRRLLIEPDVDVRGQTLDELARRKEPEAIRRLTQALSIKDMDVVGRAAWALAGLQAVAAVPKLIPKLVVVDQQIVFVPQTPPMAASPPGTAGMVPTPGVNAPGFSPPGPYPVLTGPVVAPGVVAYGATQVGNPAGGSSFGVGPSPGPVPKVLSTVYPNADVHDALVKLTGQDFGYDIATWRRWLASGPRPASEPVRRVPQR
jgi:hypothetical protein